MPKEKFILVSLNEDESKKLAQIVSNDTARRILDFLADKEATESELAGKLNIPISTVHYNLQALVKGRLVDADQYHYSEKGKEVLHYRLANKYIIIAPKSTFGIKEKLKSILPVGLVALATAGAIQLVSIVTKKPLEAAAPMLKAAPRAMEEAVAEVPRMAAEAGAAAPTTSYIALWFLLGALFCIILFVIFEFIRKIREK